MNLTDEERAWLAGEGGPGLRKAMEIIVALGTIYGAADTVPVSSVGSGVESQEPRRCRAGFRARVGG